MATSAPSSRQRASFSGDPAVHATLAPKALPSWIAMVPIPPLPPWTSSVSPPVSRASWKTFAYTVHAVSGNAAAVVRSTRAGTGRTCPAGTTTCSA